MGVFNCPNCRQSIEWLRNRIKDKSGQPVMQTVCPYCGHVFKEEFSAHSQATRLLFLVFGFLLVIFGAVFLLIAIDSNFPAPYRVIGLITVMALIILGAWKFFRIVKATSEPEEALGTEYSNFQGKSTKDKPPAGSSGRKK